jgi:hypothetical protein
MLKRGFIGLLWVLLILPMFLAGCPTEDEDPAFKPAPIGTYSGTGTGQGDGFARSAAYVQEHGAIGTVITVTVTMQEGFMTAVAIDGPDESPGFGAVVVEKLPAEIKKYNTFDLGKFVDGSLLDTISSASTTYKAIKAGGEQAISQIKNLPQ